MHVRSMSGAAAALAVVVAVACAAAPSPATRADAAAGSDARTPTGTYAVAPGPVADGDSSTIELVADPDGTAWGWWVRHGDHPVVPVRVTRAGRDSLALVATMGAGDAALRLALAPGGAFTGEWARAAERIPFRGVRRAGPPSAALRELAAAAPFAPGAVSTPDSGESFASLSPDGREFYFTTHRPDRSRHRVVVSRVDGARWSRPQPLPFSGTYNDREPKLSPDGRRLWFSSDRPASPADTARRRDLDLWFAERAADGGWSAPRHAAGAVNTEAQEFSPVEVAGGALYFVSTRAGGVGPAGRRTINVWRTRPTPDGGYGPPENPGPAVNTGVETNVYVTPDERVMLVSRDGAPDGDGGDDLYASERRDGVWQPMRHLPRPINSPAYDYGPLLSPDGRWLFFTSHRRGTADVYRVDARLLDARLLDARLLAARLLDAPSTSAARQDDTALVRRAVLDYVEGFYEGDSAKLVRSVRPEVFKYGFWRGADSTRYHGETMPFAEFLSYARSVKARSRQAPPTARKDVVIYDVQNQTASAKLTAFWGTDYLLLGRYDGRWMVSSVMWQSPPRRP